MKKNVLFFKGLFVLALHLLYTGGLQAQYTITIGTGTDEPTSNNSLWAPVYRTNSNTVIHARSNTLFTQAELAAAGLVPGARIDSLQYYKTVTNNFTVPANYSLYMGNTDRTLPSAVWQDIINEQDLVYANASFNLPNTIGWVTIVLTTPFYYTGGSLSIATDQAMNGDGGTTGALKFQYTASFPNETNMVVGANSTTGDDIPVLNNVGSAPKHRANIKISFSTVPCAGTLVGGTAVSSKKIACEAESFRLNLTGQSVSTSQTYQWELSTDNSTWTKIDSTGRSIYIGLDTTQTQTTYYRCKLYCGGDSAVSAAVMVQSPSQIAASVFTINKNIAASATNFQSFQDAIEAIKCGISGPVVFNVTPGVTPYTGTTTIPEIPGLSATNTITFNGNGATVAFAGYDANAPAAFILQGADHLIFDSLTFDGSSTTEIYAVDFLLTGQADSNIIRNCHFMGSSSSSATTAGFSAIMFSGSLNVLSAVTGNNANYNLITGNTFDGGGYNVYMLGDGTTLNKGNAVTRNVFTNYYNYAISAYGQEDVIISENDMSRPVRTGGGAYQIYIGNTAAPVTGALIEKNRIHNPYGGATTVAIFYGIRVGASASVDKPNIIQNNIIYDIKGTTGAVYGVYASNLNYLNIYHNTIVFDDATVAGTGTTYGIYAYLPTLGASDVSTLNVKNNIIYITRNGTAAKYGLYYYTSGTGVTSSDNNVLYVNSAGGSNNAAFLVSAYATLAAWKASNSGKYDQASTDVNPLFTDIANYNFKPTEPTIANMGAAGTGVTTDIFGIARSANPTPGAIEVVSVAPVNLLDFTGVKAGAANRLAWTTVTENNNSGFELERSADGQNFTTLTFVASKASNGNSSSRLSYGFTDVQPFASSWYRLKQTDKDGKAVYSNVVFLKSVARAGSIVAGLYPNPAHSQLTVIFDQQATGKLNLLVMDINGKQVMNVPVSTTNGLAKISIGSLPAGTYLLKAFCSNGCESSVQKFVVQ